VLLRFALQVGTRSVGTTNSDRRYPRPRPRRWGRGMTKEGEGEDRASWQKAVSC